MAIFHSHSQVIGRSSGRSVVAACAYRSGSRVVEQITCSETGVASEKIWDYSKKKGVAFSAIFAPELAPEWVFDREQLWNRVNEGEKRADAQLAREFDIALPVELSLEQNIELLQEIARECFVSHGMVADVNMHMDNPENPHAHVMLSMRDLVAFENGEVGFGLKNRSWNARPFLVGIRERIAMSINKHLQMHGFDSEVSHLSHKDRGIDLAPTIHVGLGGKSMEEHERREFNRQIIAENAARLKENPELILSKLSISKPVFTEEDIARVVSDTITADLEFAGQSRSGSRAGSSASRKAELEELNSTVSGEFLSLYSKVLGSEELALVTESDLRGNRLYAKRSRLDLERRYLAQTEELAARKNHQILLSDEELDKRSLKEEIGNSIMSGAQRAVDILEKTKSS